MTRQHFFALLLVASAAACRSPNPYHYRPSSDGGDDSGGSGDESGGPSSTSTNAATSADATGDGTSGSADEHGTDADASTSGTDEGSSTGSTDEGPLACTGVCVSAPAGWNGPVVLATGDDDPPSCDDPAYVDLAVAGYRDVVAPEAQCDCECNVGEEVECAATLTRFSSNSCLAIDDSFDLAPGCNVVGAAAGYFEISYDASGGACDPSPSMELPAFDVSGYAAACGTMAMADGVCDGEASCVPAPAAAVPLCWWSEGDVPCPEMLEASRDVIYTEDAFDDRGCEACSCNAVSGSCEESIAYAVDNNVACQLLPPHFLPISAGDCTSLGAVQSLLLGAPTPETTCTAAGTPAATGSVEPQGPVTVCCAG